MKKLNLAVMVVVMMMTMVAGCSNDKEKDSGMDPVNVTVDSQANNQVNETTNENDNNLGDIQVDIAVNIEGVVTEIDGNRVTLDTGKVVTITEDTIFETQDIGEIVEIGQVIEVGNYIQGFTSGDSDAEEIIADVINMNEKMQISSKIAINIEGFVIAVDENVITLDNGQKFIVNEETAYETQVEGDMNSPMTSEINNFIEIGNYIQGFTMDDLEEEIVVAVVINHNGEL